MWCLKDELEHQLILVMLIQAVRSHETRRFDWKPFTVQQLFDLLPFAQIVTLKVSKGPEGKIQEEVATNDSR